MPQSETYETVPMIFCALFRYYTSNNEKNILYIYTDHQTLCNNEAIEHNRLFIYHVIHLGGSYILYVSHKNP